MSHEDIVRAFSAPDGARTGPIDRAFVLECMSNDDLEVQGRAFEFLSEGAWRRVAPELSVSDYLAFVQQYLGQCLREDPEGRWCHARYEAAGAVAYVFARLWDDDTIPRSELEQLRDWLAKRYLRGDKSVRDVLVTGALHVLVRNPQIKSFFKGWEANQTLREGYERALLP